jgi:hypothetical protein
MKRRRAESKRRTGLCRRSSGVCDGASETIVPAHGALAYPDVRFGSWLRWHHGGMRWQARPALRRRLPERRNDKSQLRIRIGASESKEVSRCRDQAKSTS